MTAPLHLSDESQRFWMQTTEFFLLEPHELKLLQLALESFDRCQQARKIIAVDGMTVRDRFDQSRPHPLLTTERDNRTSFFRLLKELNLGKIPVAAGAAEDEKALW